MNSIFQLHSSIQFKILPSYSPTTQTWFSTKEAPPTIPFSFSRVVHFSLCNESTFTFTHHLPSLSSANSEYKKLHLLNRQPGRLQASESEKQEPNNLQNLCLIPASNLLLITDVQLSHPNCSAALWGSWVFHRGSYIFLVCCALGGGGLLLCRGLWASRGLDNWPVLINPYELFHSSRTFHRCRNESGQHSSQARTSWAKKAWYCFICVNTQLLCTHARSKELLSSDFNCFLVDNYERSENVSWGVREESVHGISITILFSKSNGLNDFEWRERGCW